MAQSHDQLFQNVRLNVVDGDKSPFHSLCPSRESERGCLINIAEQIRAAFLWCTM